MLLLNAVLVIHAAGGAAFVKESAEAVKSLQEGEFALVAKGSDSTTECRMLVSERDKAFRMTFLKDGKAAADIAFVDGKGAVVDYESRTFQIGFDLNAVGKQVEDTKKKEAQAEIADGNISVNLDSAEGLVVRANPGMENVRKWTAGQDELFTGDFGKGSGKRGTFQWVRDAKTKLPKSFSGFMDDHAIDIRFTYTPKRTHLGDFRIPTSAYDGFTPVKVLPEGIKVGG